MSLETWMETTAAQPPPATPLGGSAEAPPFEQLYDEHVEFVWRGLRRLGVRESELDDAVQEVFVVVHRRLADFEGKSALRTWLFGIVLRTARTLRRTSQRRPESPLDEGSESTLACPAASLPDDSAADAEAIRILYALLDELDEDKREAFVLAELEEMTAPEIAEALSLNLNTVYARVRAARKAFEQALARYHARDGRRRP